MSTEESRKKYDFIHMVSVGIDPKEFSEQVYDGEEFDADLAAEVIGSAFDNVDKEYARRLYLAIVPQSLEVFEKFIRLDELLPSDILKYVSPRYRIRS